MQRLFQLVLVGMLSCLLCWQSTASAENIEITEARIEPTEDGYSLAATFQFELSREFKNVIASGIPLYFVTDVEITRPRWYWLDQKTVTAHRSVRISYNVITRQYRASVNGSFAQNYQDLSNALALVRTPSRWLVAEKSHLDYGVTYNVAVRMRLDTDQLPKPFQFNAFNNSDWRLSSDWKYFTFKANEPGRGG